MVFAIGNTILSLVLNFVCRTVFIQVLGVSLLGINGLFANILQLLSLADLGFGTAMAYSYYKPISQNDYGKIASLNKFYRKIYNTIAAGVAAIGLALLPFLKYLINLDTEIPYLHIYYLLALANSVVSYLFVYKSAVITAYQKNYIVTKYTAILSIVSAVLRIALLVLTHNYFIYLIIGSLSVVASNFIISRAADKLFPFLKQGGSLDKETKSDIIKNMKSVFIYKISGVLINSTDNILISVIVGTIVVGYYSNYNLIITSITTFVTLIFTSLTASLGNLVISETAEKKYSVFKTVQLVSFWFTIVIIPSVYVVINDFIIVWLGEAFLMDHFTLFAIMLNFYLQCVLQPIWIYREATGMYRKTKYIMLITAIVNVGLSILFGIWWGLAGILLASAVAKLCTYIWYEPILLFKNYFNESPKTFFISVIMNLVGAAVLAGLLFLLSSLVTVSSILGFFIKGVIAFVICNLVYVLFFHKKEEFATILNIIKKVIPKKKR